MMFTDQDELLLRSFGIDSEEDTPEHVSLMREGTQILRDEEAAEDQVRLFMWICIIAAAGVAAALIRGLR